MLIICPNCTKSYHIARTSLGTTGRAVQCSGCHENWQCGLAGADDRGEGRRETDIASDDHRSDVPVPPRGAGPLIAGEVLAHRPHASYDSLYGTARPAKPAAVATAPPNRTPAFQLAAAALVMAAAMGCTAARDTLVSYVPHLGDLYASIGLPVNARGIAFGPVKSVLAGEGANAVLSVEGTVTNLRKTAVKLPEIIASLKGTDGRDVYTWTSPAPKAILGPGETAGFRTRLATPPGNGGKVILRFAQADESVRSKDTAAR